MTMIDSVLMAEKEKALKLIKQLRECAYDHGYTDEDMEEFECMAIDEEIAIECVEEIFNVSEQGFENQ